MRSKIIHIALCWSMALAAAGVVFSGCSTTQQVVKKQKAFFKPFTYRAKVQSTAVLGDLKAEYSRLERKVDSLRFMNDALNNETVKLRQALDAKERQIASLSDSILAVRHEAAKLQAFAQTVPPSAKQQSPVQSPTTTQSLATAKPTESVKSVVTAPPPQAVAIVVAAPARPNADYRSYENAVAQMNKRDFTSASESFQALLENGVREDLADNCEYWIGEISFEKRKYAQAVASFEKVIAMAGSNKVEDAMLMLGKSYEALELLPKAKAAYERLTRIYPNSWQAKSAHQRLQDAKFLPTPRPQPSTSRTAT